MKVNKIQLFLILALFTTILSAQNQNPNYDAKLAKELGADDYGMKMYTLVLLTTGTNQDQSNLKNEGNYRGIFILNTTDVEEAKQFLAADLAIQNKYLKAEYIPYYGSAALSSYLVKHDKIWKLKP